MKATQYTLRPIPDPLDKALRERARKSGKSINQTAIEILARGLGVSKQPKEYHDLDWFIGSKKLDDNFDEAIDWLDSLPNDLTP